MQRVCNDPIHRDVTATDPFIFSCKALHVSSFSAVRGDSDHGTIVYHTFTSVLATVMLTVVNYHLGGKENTRQSGPVRRMGGLAIY